MVDRPLRIVHVTNEPFGMTYANGVQHAVYGMANAQADLGNSVAVFTRDDRAVHFLGAETQSDVEPPGSAARRPVLMRHWFAARYFEPAMAERVLAWRPDIVHFHSVHIPQNVALADSLRDVGIPYCVTVHGGLFPPAFRRNVLRKVAFKLLFEQRYLNGAAFVQALSSDEASALKDYGIRAPIVVIPNAMPLDTTLRGAPPAASHEADQSARGARIFLFLGRLDPWQKGLDLLLRGFASLPPLDRAVLIVAGDDRRQAREELERLAARLGIASQVVFKGPAFGDQRANLFASADVFVHPSRWEGVSLSVLVAAAAGKPCLLTRHADPAGALQRAGGAIVVEPTVADITAGLNRALAMTAGELQAMGEHARQVARNQPPWSTIGAMLVSAYRDPKSAAEPRLSAGSHPARFAS
jgi:glycosyltransferase involved in cell wall biosynthesis